jgi:predicted MFS family arabinose efflux permease
VRGSYQMVSTGSRPLGALVGSALGEFIGVRATLWIAIVGGTLAFVWLIPSTAWCGTLADGGVPTTNRERS